MVLPDDSGGALDNLGVEYGLINNHSNGGRHLPRHLGFFQLRVYHGAGRFIFAVRVYYVIDDDGYADHCDADLWS